MQLTNILFNSDGHMIEGLYHTDWNNLTHAAGQAGNVPGMLLALTSPEALERELGFHLMRENLCRGGALYEAGAHAVPYLIQLAVDPQFKEKKRLLRFLAMIARAQAPLDVLHQNGDLVADEAIPEIRARLARERGWVDLAKTSLRRSLVPLTHFLDHREPAVRVETAYLLSSFPEDCRRFVPQLAERIDGEQDALVLAGLLLAISAFDPWCEISIRRFRRIAGGSYPSICRLAALMGLARQMKGDAPVEVLVALVDFLSSLDRDLPAQYSSLPWAQGHLFADMAVTLAGFGPAYSAEILPDLMRVINRVDPESAVRIARVMLTLAFPPDAPTKAFTQLQMAVLATLAACSSLWQAPAAAGKLLHQFHLPDRPEKLRVWIG